MVFSRLGKRTVRDDEKLKRLKETLEKNGFDFSQKISVANITKQVLSLPDEAVGQLYMFAQILTEFTVVRYICCLTEQYHFSPKINRTKGMINKVISEAQKTCGISGSEEFDIQLLYIETVKALQYEWSKEIKVTPNETVDPTEDEPIIDWQTIPSKPQPTIGNGGIERNTNDVDDDLNPLLENASNEQLNPLVEIIVGTRSNELKNFDAYKKHKGNHVMYADLIASELRAYGGNTFANYARYLAGNFYGVLAVGPAYQEVVGDVAKKLNVNFNSKSPVVRIERAILEKILSDAVDKMSEKELKDILGELGENKDFAAGKPASAAVIIGIFRAGGFKSYQLAVIVANAVVKAILGHGLPFVINTALTKTLAILTGPIGWVITAIWGAIDLAGPAFRVTVPSIVYVATLRMQGSEER
jgi:uncharacterized protein YaaW (UPF0174 family)